MCAVSFVAAFKTPFRLILRNGRLMSYQVLARKWRPRTFQEMVGQEHVLRALINALDHQRLHHAYLFTGTRGVGKTTLARIFAKALCCKEGPSIDFDPNDELCIEIAEGRCMDVLEIDGASNNGVAAGLDLGDPVFCVSA